MCWGSICGAGVYGDEQPVKTTASEQKTAVNKDEEMILAEDLMTCSFK